MNAALLITCAASLLLNIIAVSYMNRQAHWLRYWRKAFNEAVSPISPPSLEPELSGKTSAITYDYDWVGDWD